MHLFLPRSCGKKRLNMACTQTKSHMSIPSEEVVYSLHAQGIDDTDDKYTFTFPAVHNVAMMRIGNVEVDPATAKTEGDAEDYMFVQIVEGGYTSHSAYFDGNVETNIALKINLPSSSVPSSWNSTGIIKTGRSALRSSGIGNTVDRVTIRLLRQDLNAYTDSSFSFDLTLVSLNSA